MKLLPYDTLSAEVPAPPEEVVAFMREKVAAIKLRLIALSPKVAPFQGSVRETGFTILRTSRIRNSFRPLMQGSFEPLANGGTTVHVRLTLHWLVIGFMCAWLGILGMVSLGGVLVLLMKGQPLILLIAGAMGLLGVSIPLVAFWAEVGISKKLLLDVLGELPARGDLPPIVSAPQRVDD